MLHLLVPHIFCRPTLTYSLEHGWPETKPREAGEEEDVHDGDEDDDDGGVEQT